MKCPIRYARLRRGLQRPWVSLAALALLAVDFAMLPYDQGFERKHSYAKWFVMKRFEARATVHRAAAELFLVKKADGTYRALGKDSSDDAEFSQLLRERPQDLLWFYAYFTSPSRVGFWAPTEEYRSAMLRFGGSQQSVDANSSASRIEAAGLVRDWLFKEGYSDGVINQLMAGGGYHDSRPLYLGYAHNTASAAVAIVFLFSLGWLRAIPEWLTTTKAQRRLSRGMCPNCRYDITGLAEPICPECGRSWRLTADDPLVASRARRAGDQ